jgi:dTMP kinase
MIPRGTFITFESIDGVGKSTQINELYNYLRDSQPNDEILLTKEPGDARCGSNIGNGVRQLLFHEPSTKQMHPGVADLLFLADHVQNAEDVSAAIDRGAIVLCDRYADSQFAYCASSSKKVPDWAMQYYRERFGIVPDVTVLLVASELRDTHREPEDIGWALRRAQGRRGVEAGKQDGKAWNDLQEQRIIQTAYIERLLPLRRTLPIYVREKDTVQELHMRILSGIMARLSGFEDMAA